MKTRIFLIVVFLLSVAAGLHFTPRFLHDESPAQAAAAPELVPVYVAPAALGRVYDSVEALGTAFSMESVDITSNVSELVREIRFDDGAYVRKGEIIAVLEQRELQAQLEAARARLEQDRRELNRLEGLLKDRAVPRQDYEARQTMLEVTRREVEAIEARIAYRTLRAPFDGVLGVRRISPGALVQPGDVITTLDDISSIKLDFTVPSAYLAALRPGVEIQAVADALEGRVFSGRVESVNTRIDPITRAVLVRAILPNRDGMLRPGLLLKVTLIKNERQAVVLPEETLLQRQDDHFAMVVGADGLVEQRKVGVGARLPGQVEITSGLDAGERVVVRGINRVQDGQRVRVAEVWDAAPGWDAVTPPAGQGE